MKNNKDDNKLKAILSTICVLIVIGAIAGVVYLGQNNKEEKELAYTELIHDVNNGEIEKIGSKEEVLPLLLNSTNKPCKVMLDKTNI